jgi:hypothetical protein
MSNPIRSEILDLGTTFSPTGIYIQVADERPRLKPVTVANSEAGQIPGMRARAGRAKRLARLEGAPLWGGG